MTQESLSDQVEYEERDGVGIWKIDDMAEALKSEGLEAGEEHFRETAGRESMNACVVVVGNADAVGSEELKHVNEQWTRLGDETDLERTAYVADGIAKLAIANKNEAKTMTSKGFNDVSEAIEWAKEV